MEGIFFVIISLICVCVVITVKIIKEQRKLSSDNPFPKTSHESQIVSTRKKNRSGFGWTGGMLMYSFSSEYFITFEFISTSTPIEFSVPASVYKKFKTYDKGIITIHGSRFVKFEKHLRNEEIKNV